MLWESKTKLVEYFSTLQESCDWIDQVYTLMNMNVQLSIMSIIAFIYICKLLNIN